MRSTAVRRVRTLLGSLGLLAAALPVAAQPSNDGCESPVPLTPGSSLFSTSVGATPTLHPLYGFALTTCVPQDELDVWYSLSNPTDSPQGYVVSVEALINDVFTDPDTYALAAFDACDGNQLACNAVRDISAIDLVLEPAQTVLFRVAASLQKEGSFSITVSEPLAPPANDSCESPTPVAALPFSDRVTLGSARNDTDVSCDSVDGFSKAGVWYTYTPAADTFVDISEDGPQSSLIAVFTGSCGELTAHRCLDRDSTVGFPAFAGTTYRILVARGGDWQAPPSTELLVNMRSRPLPAPPQNDACSSAKVVATTPYTETVNVGAAGDDGAVSCFFPEGFTAHLGVWYRYTAPSDGSLLVSETNPAESIVTYFTGECGSLTAVSCSFGYSALPIPVTQGQTYHVLVARFDTRPAYYADAYAVRFELLPVTPPNDACAGATPVAEFPFVQSSPISAATDDVATLCSEEASVTSAGVWYTLTPPRSGVLSLEHRGWPPEVVFALFTGGCSGLAEVGCGQTFFPVQAGVPYHILAGRRTGFPPSPSDTLRLTIDLRDRMFPGETCASALEVATPVHAFVNNAMARAEFPSDAPAGSCNDPAVQEVGMNNSVYFRFTAPSDGTLTGSVRGLYVGALVAVYAGTCGSLQEIACGLQLGQAVSFEVPVAAGTSYLIQLGSYGAGGGFGGDGGGDALVDLSFEPDASCPADFDGQNGVQVADIFAFLRAWFANSPSADFDGQNGIQVADIFAFLRAWFAGC